MPPFPHSTLLPEQVEKWNAEMAAFTSNCKEFSETQEAMAGELLAFSQSWITSKEGIYMARVATLDTQIADANKVIDAKEEDAPTAHEISQAKVSKKAAEAEKESMNTNSAIYMGFFSKPSKLSEDAFKVYTEKKTELEKDMADVKTLSGHLEDASSCLKLSEDKTKFESGLLGPKELTAALNTYKANPGVLGGMLKHSIAQLTLLEGSLRNASNVGKDKKELTLFESAKSKCTGRN